MFDLLVNGEVVESVPDYQTMAVKGNALKAANPDAVVQFVISLTDEDFNDEDFNREDTVSFPQPHRIPPINEVKGLAPDSVDNVSKMTAAQFLKEVEK